MKPYKSAYAIPIPFVQPNSVSVQFSARVAGSIYGFLFQWFNSMWNLSVTFPDNSVRLASVVPGVTSWTAYPDFGLLLTSDMTQLGQNDLPTVSMYWIVWV